MIRPRIWKVGDRFDPHALPPDMTEQDFHELSSYNGEVARGLVHTPEWKAKMAVFQERWNRWAVEQAAARGDIVIPDQSKWT
jgi:hypothetical protein